MPYDAYDSDTLHPGYNMKIERTVYRLDNAPEEIEPYLHISEKDLTRMRDESIAAEKLVFEKLREAAKEWEVQSATTCLLTQVLKYLNTHVAEHTSNEWVELGNGWHQRSNTVYSMRYHIEAYTRYDRDTGENIPEYYRISWSVFLNTPKGRSTTVIAGQSNKRFTDRDKMDKYLAGRIKAYDRLFTDINPFIPAKYANYFKVNGLLLPGYTIQTASL